MTYITVALAVPLKLHIQQWISDLFTSFKQWFLVANFSFFKLLFKQWTNINLYKAIIQKTVLFWFQYI